MKNYPNFSLFLILTIVLIVGLFVKSCDTNNNHNDESSTCIDTVDIYYQYGILDGDTLLMDITSSDPGILDSPYAHDLMWEEIPTAPYYVDSVLFIPHYTQYPMEYFEEINKINNN